MQSHPKGQPQAQSQPKGQPQAPGQAARPSAVDAAVFLAELALLAVLAVAGARLGGNLALRITLAIVLPLAAAAGWGRWLAPRASRRLANPARLAAKIGIFAVASVLLAVAGLAWWAAAFFALSVVLNVIAERPAAGRADRDQRGSAALAGPAAND